MKAASPDWGYGHIHGELKKLGYKISWQTVPPDNDQARPDG